MAGSPYSLLGGLLFLAGCSASVSPSVEADADATAQTTAVVTFERVTSGETTRASAVARFVQARQGATTIDDHALRLVGAAFDLPPAAGCIALADEVDGAHGRAIELADVGAVVVTSPSGSFGLVPRQVPDPVGLVGGVLYYAPSATTDVAPGARYLVRGAGSTDVPAFEMVGNAPLDLADVRVAGQVAGARVSITAPVDITWALAAEDRLPDTGGRDADAFFVDVSTSRGTMRCAADVASAALPASAFLADEGTIAVHRVHRDLVSSRARARQTGIESSEVRFDYSRVIAFTRH
jgi:hypothetical protein